MCNTHDFSFPYFVVYFICLKTVFYFVFLSSANVISHRANLGYHDASFSLYFSPMFRFSRYLVRGLSDDKHSEI